jgi:hypothetical protein
VIIAVREADQLVPTAATESLPDWQLARTAVLIWQSGHRPKTCDGHILGGTPLATDLCTVPTRRWSARAFRGQAAAASALRRTGERTVCRGTGESKLRSGPRRGPLHRVRFLGARRTGGLSNSPSRPSGSKATTSNRLPLRRPKRRSPRHTGQFATANLPVAAIRSVVRNRPQRHVHM